MKTENKKPKLSEIEETNIKKTNTNIIRHERMKTDSDQKTSKLSKDKRIINKRNRDNINKKDTSKKLPINKNMTITSLKTGYNKIHSPVNDSSSKKDQKKTKKNNNLVPKKKKIILIIKKHRTLQRLAPP